METQFKPGDRVRIIGAILEEMNGKTGTLISKSDGGSLWALQLDAKHEQAHTCDSRIASGFGYWVQNKMIELIEPPKSKFKPGDWVRIARTEGDVEEWAIGKTGTLVTQEQSVYKGIKRQSIPWALRFDAKHDKAHSCNSLVESGFGYWATDSEIEPIEPKTKFKVGDRVRCIDNTDSRGKGRLGYVTDNTWEKTDRTIRVQFDAPFDGHGDDSREWNCDIDTLVLTKNNKPCIIVKQYSNEIAAESESLTEATKTAERFAIADPGAVFHIYKLVAHTTAIAPVATTELA